MSRNNAILHEGELLKREIVKNVERRMGIFNHAIGRAKGAIEIATRELLRDGTRTEEEITKIIESWNHV